MTKQILREEYLKKLRLWKDKDFIKVITGARRCGKSTLMNQFQNELLQSTENNVISLNLEDIEYDFLTDYKTLYDYILKRIASDKMNYIFIDEIQKVKQFEKAVDSLYIKDNLDIYITGSNSNMLSSELATLLTGRYIEISLLPFSFSEICNGLDINPRSYFNEFLEFGGFPRSTLSETNEEKDGALHSIFETSIIKDVVNRVQNIDETKLRSVIDFIFNNIGCFLNPEKISNTMTSNKEKISNHSVSTYLRLLSENFTLYPAQRYDIQGKKLLQTNKKYYLVDQALRRATGSRVPKKDLGHALENVIYIELLRRFPKVWVGKIGDLEVDFIVSDYEGNVQYIQVAYFAMDETIMERELAPFRRIKDNYVKVLLSLDDIRPQNYSGIHHINAIDWLIGKTVI